MHEICRDQEGIVHALSGESDTWCGWSRIWFGGEWPVVRDAVVTCLACVVDRARHQSHPFVATPSQDGKRVSPALPRLASHKLNQLAYTSSAPGTTEEG